MNSLPPFDDSRKALTFALNLAEHDIRMPRPAMNKAMAEGATPKKLSKAAAKKARQAKLNAGLMVSDTPDVLEGTRKHDSIATARRDAHARWLGLEPAAQAGLILLEFGKLDREHRIVLTGLLTRSSVPCSCRAPCCSGWAQVPRWTIAVEQTCELMKDSSDLVRMPGKKGLSTQPTLRRAIVEAWYTKREVTLVELAGFADVTSATAAKHRAWIIEGLERIETEAWLQVDAMFDAAGITGTIIT